jgi:hypothetical protein
MILQIETITVANGGRMDVIRDIETVKKLVAIAEKAMLSIRDFHCGHKPNGVSGKCAACEALKEWDNITDPHPARNQSSDP